MVLFGEKQPRCVLAGCLIFVITGALAFSMTETLDLSELEAKRMVPGASLASTEITLDWLAEGAAIIGKDEGHSPSSLSFGNLRMSASPGIQNAGILFVQSDLNTIKKTQYHDIRNTIFLKLRI
jgi:hypothetical protein